MAQNIYDNPDFLNGYRQLPRSMYGLDGAPEWPALQSLLPDLNGSTVVDLGCGFGWFCRWAAQAGAASVLGVDVSEKMLEQAVADTDAVEVTYRRADLEQLVLGEGVFDLAYSSLTLHYVSDFAHLVGVVHRALRPGGRLVFSVEHPIFTAPSNAGFVEVGGSTVWPVDGYASEGERRTAWFIEGVLKYHRTVGTYLSTLIGAGFAISHVEEWVPNEEQLGAHPEWANEVHRPPFLLVGCERP